MLLPMHTYELQSPPHVFPLATRIKSQIGKLTSTRDGNVSPIQREIKSNAIISQANSKKQETEGATLQSH